MYKKKKKMMKKKKRNEKKQKEAKKAFLMSDKKKRKSLKMLLSFIGLEAQKITNVKMDYSFAFALILKSCEFFNIT